MLTQKFKNKRGCKNVLNKYNGYMDKKNKIIINEKKIDERLDIFLAKNFPEYSRSFWQAIIRQEGVLLNDKKISPHYKLKIDDAIFISQKILKGIAEQKKIDLSPDKKIKLKIIFEDKDFLIIDKPSGLTVHPSESVPKNTLVNGLLAYLPKLKNIGEDETRPGIIHRLDKDVSGIMAVAKNQKSFECLKSQFQNREIKKEYLALVHGIINKESGEINLKIGRSKKTGLMATGRNKNYREAKTLFWTVKKFQKNSLLKIQILTGRTHQIRVHLKAINHPVVGDKIYCLKKYKNSAKIKRMFLHSYKLGFKNLKNEWVEFEAELPNEFKKFYE
ncbi:RluA family pseudouridine synthase [Candidatus Parcubacteria bacterium]|nr:RluA family pseudouridine synthase [Candidatus Parcubacteria bacterium]